MRLTDLPPAPNVLDGLRPAVCHVGVDWSARRLAGYILLPDRGLSSVHVWVNGSPVGACALATRPEVAALFPQCPHAERSCFEVACRPEQLPMDRVNGVTLIGCQDECAVARQDVLVFHPSLVPAVPTPPAELIVKAQGNADVEAYRASGFLQYHQILRALARHRTPGSGYRLLDYGCGCGRVAAHFLTAPDRPQLHGCDIDADAIAFCGEHLRPGEFTLSDGFALPYPDAAFDVVISLFAFVAFDRTIQGLLLPELRRVLAPGGLLLVTLQGPFVGSFLFPPAALSELFKEGIFWDESCWETPTAEYARGVFQTPEYTRREWSRHFEVLDYLEGEIRTNDLVVLRRPLLAD